MKILFDHNRHDPSEDWNVNLGIGWYKHAKRTGTRFKSWNGLTIVFYLIRWQFHITWVDDYDAYQARMNFRYSDYLKDKK